ncbi:hypothetical protein PENTCL1PPCAC_10380, partial [Pristionchus entomophagus]
ASAHLVHWLLRLFPQGITGTIVHPGAINIDSLSPWTSSYSRSKTKKFAMMRKENMEYVVTRDDWRSSNTVLVQVRTNLPRCPRLSKRIFYVMRNNLTILGYVLFMYEYTTEGDPPEIQQMDDGME